MSEVAPGQVDVEPSSLVAFLHGDAAELTVNELEAKLAAAGLGYTAPIVAPEERLLRTRWQVQLEVTLPASEERPAMKLPVEIASLRTQEVPGFQLEHARLSPREQDEVTASRYSVAVTSSLNTDDPLRTFHALFKVALALAPELVLLYDVDAAAAHHVTWVKETAASAALPPPTALYTIHAVQSEAGDGVWMHTHGLHRCGAIELELFDAPVDEAGGLASLINTAAAMWLERGVPAPDEVFWVGEDLPLVWLDWPAALKAYRPRSGGDVDDRDAAHSGARAVLFAPGKKVLGLFGSRYKLPAVLLPVLEDNPLLFISTAETERMRVLSRERLDELRALFAQFHEDEHWVFLVKLGYAVDDEDHAGVDHEHLWFELHGLEDDRVDATLINQPYSVARLMQGDRGWHPLTLMSDWAVMSPLGRFGPDRVGLLHHLLERLVDDDAGVRPSA